MRRSGRTFRDVLHICLKLSEGLDVLLVYAGNEGARGFYVTREVANRCRSLFNNWGVASKGSVNGSFQLSTGTRLIVSSNHIGYSHAERYVLHGD